MSEGQKSDAYVNRFEDEGYRIFRSELAYIKKRRTASAQQASEKGDDSHLVKSDKSKNAKDCKDDNGETDAKERPSTRHNLIGLCLSGGGIRSATFSLGFLQALFHWGILRRIDYLSTVSGGGYIGSCLTALLSSDLNNVKQSKQDHAGQHQAKQPQEGLPPQIDLWISENFPFEINTKGEKARHADSTQTAFGQAEKLEQKPAGSRHIEKEPVRHLRYFSDYITAGGDLITRYFRPFMILLRGVVLNLLMFIPYLVVCALLFALLFNIRGGILRLDTTKNNKWFFDLREFETALESRIIARAELEAFVYQNTINMPLAPYEQRLKQVRISPFHAPRIEQLNGRIRQTDDAVKGEWQTIWRIPLILFCIMIILTIACMPLCTSTFKKREYFGRICAIFLCASISILLIQLYGTAIVYWKVWHVHNGLLVLPVFSLLAPWLLRSLDEEEGKKKKPWVRIAISVILMALVPCLLLFCMGMIVNFLTFKVSNNYFLKVIPGLFCVALLLWYMVDRFININKISYHDFYRDRLSHAYLIQHDRRADTLTSPFEKIMHQDVIKLSEIYDTSGTIGPYHIVNSNINLSKVLPDEVKDGVFRNCESFILSKNWCGSEKTGYASTRAYEEVDPHIDLGTAMAISGAAVNIGMGQANLPVFRFLMGLLNIRLGYWALHPEAVKAGKKPLLRGKFPGSITMIRECIGSYSLNGRFINLSDGGHFDNIGVYELLRRRCKYIIVSDAEADPDMKFQALSYIIRLALIDFGIRIEIDVSDIKPDKNGYSRNHCVVGKICYPVWNELPEENGYLLYCKSSLTGREPQHLYEYKVKHPSFPHQTTADQWFDEQQFEAYRELGYQIGKKAFEPMPQIEQDTSVEEVFLKLSHFWHPHSEAVEKHFTTHTKELSRIITQIKADTDLAFMDAQMFPEWEALMRGAKPKPNIDLWCPEDTRKIRKGFYICNQMIQLMENVYTDLNLEREWEHPDNCGWMNLFMHWSWSGIFRLTWSISACTFGTRFQGFCKNRLNLSVGKVDVEEITDSMKIEEIKKGEEDTSRGHASVMGLSPSSRKRLASQLNPFEIKKLDDFIAHDKNLHKRLYIFRLKVDNPLKEGQCKDFIFGFAIMDQDYRILFFRIQDHLRRMGLGRQALKALVMKLTGICTSKVILERITFPESIQAVTEKEMKIFSHMLDSVKTEVGNKAQPHCPGSDG